MAKQDHLVAVDLANFHRIEARSGSTQMCHRRMHRLFAICRSNGAGIVEPHDEQIIVATVRRTDPGEVDHR